MSALETAVGSDRVSSTTFNIAPSGTEESPALRNYLESIDSLSAFNTSTFNRTGHDLGANFGGQYPSNCSGLVTSTADVVYETVTSTILINETTTLFPNATIPALVLITPPPACHIVTAPCEGTVCPSSSALPIFDPINNPFPKAPMARITRPTSTSTLLVTKKSAAIVRQLSPVGNLFGPSTPTTQTVAAQPHLDGQKADGQDRGSPESDMSTQSGDSSPSESDSDGHSPDKSTPQQIPTNGNSPSVSSNSRNSDSQKPGVGFSGVQPIGNDDQKVSAGGQPKGTTSSHEEYSSEGDASGNGAVSSKGGTSKIGIAGAGGVASSDEEGMSNDGGASSYGAISKNGGKSSNGVEPKPEDGSSADLQGTQYVPSIFMAGNVPISIASNAVIVGFHTISAGSPPTTVVANGQTIAVQSSQIMAQGRTVPIQAAVTPPPANTVKIDNVPVVLRPQDIEIGSKAFEHGSSPTSIIYNGQAYSWDATYLIGAGVTVAFPSLDYAPHVTAGGQVFSVFPSQLKASGRNIPLPNTAKASPFVYKGQTFSVNPSQIIAPDRSITLPPANKVTSFVYIDHSLSVDASHFMARSTTMALTSGFGIVTYNGQVLTIKPSEIIGPKTTIALSAPDDSAASPTAVTTGGLTFSIGPSAAVVGSSTYSFVPGKDPATIVTHGEAVLVGSNSVQFGNIHILIPTATPSFSAITQGGLTFSVAPSEVVVDHHTNNIHAYMIPITTVISGHTISIGPKGVGLAGTTIPLPMPKQSFSMATEGDLIFSVASSEVVLKDTTYSIASSQKPITTAIDGQKITIGPKGILVEGTTVNLPIIRTLVSVTAGGLTFSVGATDAVISGTVYAIGSGAPPQTVFVGSQTIEVGSAGVILPSTTVPPEQTPTAVTPGGLTFSVDSTEAVINGTTYAIGNGGIVKTRVEGSITMILGTDGVALPSTSIRPWSGGVQIGFSSFLGTSGVSSAAIATRSLTPIVTGKEGNKNHAARFSATFPYTLTLLGLAFGIMILGLRLS